MPTTNFLPGTTITSDWLNEVDQVVHDSDGANYVNFTPTGTGAVSRTVQGKLREFIDPFDFLSDAEKADVQAGTAAVDCTTNMQKAFDAAAGREIRFSYPGPYLIYAVKVSANTIVSLGTATLKKRPATGGDQTVGQFMANTTVWDVAGYAPFFGLKGNNIVIRGGTLDGNYANDTLGVTTWSGTWATYGNRAGITGSTNDVASLHNATIENVKFQNMVGACIVLDLDGVLQIEGCIEDDNHNLFAFTTGDSLADPNRDTRGTCHFIGNQMEGDRAVSTTHNSVVIDRNAFVECRGNVSDCSAAATPAGWKIQDSYRVVFADNNLLNDRLKPQSDSAFWGEVFTITGNVFSTNAPSTDRGGVDFGLHRVRSLSVSGNAFLNSRLVLERASDDISVTGNSFRCIVDCRLGGAGSFPAITGGINQGTTAGKLTVAANTVDMGGFDGHMFFVTPAGQMGVNEVRDNLVMGCDACFDCSAGASESSAAVVRLIGNTFRANRLLGRLRFRGMAELSVCDNIITGMDATTPTNLTGTTSEFGMYFQTVHDAAYTWGPIAFNRNISDASLTTAFLICGITAGSTFPSLTIKDNVLFAYNSVSGQTISGATAAITITDVIIEGNIVEGDIVMPSTATLTNEWIGSNKFMQAATRKVLNTAKIKVDVVGTTATTVGAAGAAAALPAQPTGYLVVNVDGTDRKVPFYAS